jgi:hypothetical protein
LSSAGTTEWFWVEADSANRPLGLAGSAYVGHLGINLQPAAGAV